MRVAAAAIKCSGVTGSIKLLTSRVDPVLPGQQAALVNGDGTFHLRGSSSPERREQKCVSGYPYPYRSILLSRDTVRDT